jgi:hypothetical protein
VIFMLKGRDVLIGGIAAGVMMRTRVALAQGCWPSTVVHVAVPAGACE